MALNSQLMSDLKFEKTVYLLAKNVLEITDVGEENQHLSGVKISKSFNRIK